jgi:hypothetical protein
MLQTELIGESHQPVQVEYITIRKDDEKLLSLPTKKHWRDGIKSRLACENGE